MRFREILENVRKGWKWIWNSNSIWSWVVAFVVIYVFFKLIFMPFLIVVTGSSLPLAGIESSSMSHSGLGVCSDFDFIKNRCKSWSSENYICGEEVEGGRLDFEEYWNVCGDWYRDEGIREADFKGFDFLNGLEKGDVIVSVGNFDPKVGDVIIFNTNNESIAPHPIIHRVVFVNETLIKTKGDHNEGQLVRGNNFYQTDETTIKREQVIGKAVFKIPYLAWPKLFLVDILKFLKFW